MADQTEDCSTLKENELDPRIQIELEKLNNATDEINRLEIELDEANSTFRILMNDSIRKLKDLCRKLGSNCIDRARPYYDAVELSRQAQLECQRAAAKFQRANEIHKAAKETVALAEARFLSKRHEWEFDSAWQEMLNNAILKVTDAEHQKAESGREHQRRATLFNAAKQKVRAEVQTLEKRCHRYIAKSRPYFEEKIRYEAQLLVQKEKVLQLRKAIAKSKNEYAASLRSLEDISEEIHSKRNSVQKSRSTSPCGPREPGVGAELDPTVDGEVTETYRQLLSSSLDRQTRGRSPSLDLDCDLDRRSIAGSVAASSILSDEDYEPESHADLEELKQKVRELATQPVLKDDCDQKQWETDLNMAVQRLDHHLHLKECDEELSSK